MHNNQTNTIQLKQINSLLQQQGYITDDMVAMSVFLSLQLNKPLLIEGPAGVGKTEIAKVMARYWQQTLYVCSVMKALMHHTRCMSGTTSGNYFI